MSNDYLNADLTAELAPAMKARVNIMREIFSYGMTLTLYEMTPAGQVELTELADNWGAMRKEDFRNYPEHPWMFEIFDEGGYISESVRKRVAIVKVGEKQFTVGATQSEQGSLGLWKFRAKEI